MSNNQQIIDAPSERTIRTRTVKYSGYVIETTVEEYELNKNTVLTRDVVEMPGAVAVAVLNDNDELLMLNQYRHPVRMNLWEVPAGLLDIDGEDPLVAAQRELAEEADLQAETWNALTDYFSSPGATSEAGRVYLARNLSELPAEERSERTDEEAEMTYRWVPLTEAVQLVLGGKVHNALAIQAVLATYAAAQNNFEGLQSCSAPRRGWLGVPPLHGTAPRKAGELPQPLRTEQGGGGVASPTASPNIKRPKHQQNRQRR